MARRVRGIKDTQLNHHLKEHRSLPPCSVDALLDHANALLSKRGASLVSKRTLRYYTTQDLVPSPLGSPKFARYTYEHLLSLLAARALQDQGRKLDEVRVELSQIAAGNLNQIEEMVLEWLGHGPAPKARFTHVRESRANYDAAGSAEVVSKLSAVGQSSIRIPLAAGITLEMSDSPSPNADLIKAHKELGKLIERLGK